MIPKGVTEIGLDKYGQISFFDGCDNLVSVVVEIGNPVYDSRDNCNAIIETSTNMLIAACSETTIPNTVTSIQKAAFGGCKKLASITIPGSITSIPQRSFIGCSGLKTVNINEGVTSIGEEAFADCSSLESINLSSTVNTIDDEAFRHCPSLASITVDANNQTFDSRNNCNGIINTAENKLVLGCINTVIPSSVTIIGEAAFMGSGIINCSIPNGVKTIEETAFYEVENLESLNIPNSVDSIGRECIVRCPNLKTITIGNGIKYIDRDNFYRCTNLKDFYCYAEAIPDTKNSNGYSYYEHPEKFYSLPLFNKTPIDQATLHVPAASLETYKNTAPWSGFGSIVPLTDEETSVISVKAEQQDCQYYNLKGVRVDKPGKGLYIVNGKKVVK